MLPGVLFFPGSLFFNGWFSAFFEALTFISMPEHEYNTTTDQRRRLPIYISLGFFAYFSLLISLNSKGVDHLLVSVIMEILTMPVLIGMIIFLLMNFWWLVRVGPAGRRVYGLAVLILLCGFGLIAYTTL